MESSPRAPRSRAAREAFDQLQENNIIRAVYEGGEEEGSDMKRPTTDAFTVLYGMVVVADHSQVTS